jgi:thioredoxin 1
MADVIELTDDNFQTEVLDATGPVLVDFWGPSCPPCRMIAPVIDQLAAENADSLKVGKVNVEKHPGIAGSYGIMGIPTLLIFKNGDVVEKFVGVKPKARLQQAIDEAVDS